MKIRIQKKCQVCGKSYEVMPYLDKTSKHCSKECHNKIAGLAGGKAGKGITRYPGKRPKLITRNKTAWMKQFITGLAAKNWKGDKVGYLALHAWVARCKGTPDTCEKCGKSGFKKQQIHWANIDHKYHRVLDDYIRLCAQCHVDFDKEKKLNKRRSLNSE